MFAQECLRFIGRSVCETGMIGTPSLRCYLSFVEVGLRCASILFCLRLGQGRTISSAFLSR